MAEIDRRGIPYRVVTNTSLVSRPALSTWGKSLGLRIPPDRIMSALSCSAGYTARTFPGRPLFVIASEDARDEFAGQKLLSSAEADRKGAEAAAVVIGDSPDEATYDNLNRAFRLIRGGAQLIAMHKNRWWLTPAGPTLDSGAYVAGLEYAASVKALDPGQAVRGLLPGGLVRAPRGDLARAAAGDPAGATSRWSVTTCGPTSCRPSGSACAVSSSCPASTAARS